MSPSESVGSVTYWMRQLKENPHAKKDPEAWDLLWKRYAGRLVGLAKVKLRGQSHLDAEDVALSALGSFWRCVDSGRFQLPGHRDDLFDLLAAIVTHKAYHLLEKKNALKRGGGVAPGNDLAHVLSQDPTPDLVVEFADLWHHLFGRLKDDKRRKVVQRTLDGLSQAQIAGELGDSVRTVQRILKEVRDDWLKEVEQ